MERRWAVLRSQPHREKVAARAVSARGVESYLPGLPGTRSYGSSVAPLFPGYLFAHISPDSDDLLRVRSAPGVAYLLPRAGAPALLPEVFIDLIRSREQQEYARPRGGFQRGDRVVVVSGPFKLIEGLFDRSLSASGRVRVLLNLVHGSMAVQLRSTDLQLRAKSVS